jgi:hypothetical protein
MSMRRKELRYGAWVKEYSWKLDEVEIFKIAMKDLLPEEVLKKKTFF